MPTKRVNTQSNSRQKRGESPAALNAGASALHRASGSGNSQARSPKLLQAAKHASSSVSKPASGVKKSPTRRVSPEVLEKQERKQQASEARKEAVENAAKRQVEKLHKGGNRQRNVSLPARGTLSRAPRGRAPQPSRQASRSEQQIQRMQASQGQRGSGVTHRKHPDAAARGFFYRHAAWVTPVLIILVILVGFGLYDTVTSFGKIHPGVTVAGVDVGGMTQEEAAGVLSEKLTPSLNTHITLYENEDVAADDDATIDTATTGTRLAYASETSSKESSDNSSGYDVDDDENLDAWDISATTIGAYIDGKAVASQAYQVGRKGSVIGDRLHAWFGGVKVQPVISYDKDLFEALVSEVNANIGTPIVDASAKIEKGKVTLSKGNDGLLIDESELVVRMSEAFFSSGSRNFVAPLERQPQHIKPETAQKVVDRLTTSLGSNVTITYGDQTYTMDPSTLGSFIQQKVVKPDNALAFSANTVKEEEVSSLGQGEDAPKTYTESASKDSASGYTLQAYVDPQTFDTWLVNQLGDKAKGAATDAQFDTSSGEVEIIPSSEGVGPDRAAVELDLQDLLFGTNSSASRSLALQDTIIEPSLTTEEAEAMGIKDKLSSWSIDLSGSSSRIHNIRLLCQLIDGTITAPGKTWSFNGITGERTDAKGFETAPVIIDGKHEDQLGGGVCQVATCVYNCACFAGLGIEQRTNHQFYIPAYDDEGFADATVSWETPDLEWLNDTQNYILLTADASGDEVVVTFWGTDEGRQVTCDRGEWEEGEAYKTVREEDDDLAPGEEKLTQQGVDGRNIIIHYIAKASDGTVLHDIKFNSFYAAQNEIISVGPGGDTTTTDSETNSDSHASAGSSGSSRSSSSGR